MGRELHPNLLKYIKAPTIEMIDKVIDAYGVDGKQFERFFGLYADCIKHIRRGLRQLPVHHWHIIYECLKLLEQGKELPIYREDIPKYPEQNKFLSMFKKRPSKKRTTTKNKVKRTGSLCELC
jgi:hypothetical protein